MTNPNDFLSNDTNTGKADSRLARVHVGLAGEQVIFVDTHRVGALVLTDVASQPHATCNTFLL